MKRIFTLILVMTVFLGHAQMGGVSLYSKSGKGAQIKQDNPEIILPGNWDQATEVGLYNWVDENDDPIGFIFGNNQYGTAAAGQVFNVTEPYEIMGAYFWIGSVGEGTEDIVFTIWDFDGQTVGDVLASVTMSMDQVTAFPVDENVTPDQYPETFYVEFDAPVMVSSDYILGVDFSAVPWAAMGDGIGMITTIAGSGGGGLGLAWANYPDQGGWQLVDNLSAGDLDVDLGVFPVTEGEPGQTYQVTFNVEDQEGNSIDNAVIELGPFTNEEGDYVFEEVPEGTHQYTVSAEGYADVTGEVTVDQDLTVDVVMEMAMNYQVTFTVNDQDGNSIDNATIELGPFTNDEGDYVFEEVPEGTHQYTVTAEGYATVTGEVTVEEDTTVDVVMEMSEEYEVTFNVDMTDAVAVGDVVFDPAIHDVYIAGSFPQGEWATPGSDPQFMLTPVEDPAKQDLVLYPANWEGSTPVLYTTAEGYVVGTNEYGDIGKGQVFEITEEYQITGGYFWFGAAEGSGTITYTIWDFDGTPGDVLGSVSADVSDITISDDMENAYYIAFDEPITVNSTFMMGFDMSDIGSGEVGLMSSTDPEGSDDAWEQWSDGTWYGIFDTENSFGLAIDLAIFPTVATGGGEEMIYTLTMNLPEGDYEYKYFLVPTDGEPTWDLGEYEGVHNRQLSVTGPMVVNDVWGDDPGTSVEELLSEEGLVVYPNPARNLINIESENPVTEIRVYDISGRLVHSSEVGGLSAVINVGEFNEGMYFIQVFGENRVQTQKIQVLK